MTAKHRPHNYANVVYAAEDRIRRSERPGDPVLSQGEVRALVREITADPDWAHGDVTVQFRARNPGSACAYYDRQLISLAKIGITRSVVIHELAHIATPADRGHGNTFRVEYVRLLRRWHPNYARRFVTALRHFKVKVNEVPPAITAGAPS